MGTPILLAHPLRRDAWRVAVCHLSAEGLRALRLATCLHRASDHAHGRADPRPIRHAAWCAGQANGGRAMAAGALQHDHRTLRKCVRSRRLSRGLDCSATVPNGKNFVRVGIADAGRGIRASLTPEHPDLATLRDGAVLHRMIEQGLSSRTSGSRGMGYFVLRRAARRLDGSFYLRSGGGAVQQLRRRALEAVEGLVPWRGTHLEISLTCA